MNKFKIGAEATRTQTAGRIYKIVRNNEDGTCVCMWREHDAKKRKSVEQIGTFPESELIPYTRVSTLVDKRKLR